MLPLRFLALLLCVALAHAAPVSDSRAPLADPALQVPASVRPLFDTWMCDAYVAPGGDGYYYLTGTTAAPRRTQCWDWNDGIRLWRSRDLKTWEPLGLVWSLDQDATWQKPGVMVKAGERAPSGEILGPRRRAVWSPELHYIRSRHHHIYGPYAPRYTAVVAGGHNDFFPDTDGRRWSTMFGNPRGGSARTAPFLCRLALVPMRFSAGRFVPDANR